MEFDDRDTSLAPGNLTFSTKDLGSFTALNSVQPGGIHALPNVTTGGNGMVMGDEVEFDVSFTTPFLLPSDHYFFVPQVEITTASGEFLWLSGTRPLVPSPFPTGVADLQSWTRDQMLDPDWLRVGQDIVGGSPFPTFNAAFSLNGDIEVPEPAPRRGARRIGPPRVAPPWPRSVLGARLDVGIRGILGRFELAVPGAGRMEYPELSGTAREPFEGSGSSHAGIFELIHNA